MQAHDMNSSTPDSPQQDTVLIVDDNAIDLTILRNMFQSHHVVLMAPTGERALQLAAGAPKPDLILLDVVMPDMDGYAVLARLQDNPATRDIPVIFVTGHNSAEDEEKGLEFGAVDYIVKPYRTPIVLARVHTQLELKRARDWLRNQNAYLESEVEKRVKEIQQVQIQLLQSEKMAAIGLLAAGIAHEINNPVGYVNSNLSTLEKYLGITFNLLDKYEDAAALLKDDDPLKEELHQLRVKHKFDFIHKDIKKLVAESQEGLDRVTKIILDLKGFAHADDNYQWVWADVHCGLDSTLNVVWNELKYKCEVVKEYGVLPDIYCLPSQLNQVFMNMLVNAAQAIEVRGKITVRTGQEEDRIWVDIIDTGQGIPPQNIPRLNEPFFTTKPVGRGTGLGLPVSYRIVERHHGSIEVHSEVGKGSTFRVWLPVHQPDTKETK